MELNKKRYNELISQLTDVNEAKKPYLCSLIKDFVVWEGIEEKLDGLPTFEVDPENPKRQRKLPAHDMLKDAQQRKTEIARGIMRELDGTATEESPLMALLKKYE